LIERDPRKWLTNRKNNDFTKLSFFADEELFSWEENLSGSSGLTVPKPSNSLPNNDKVRYGVFTAKLKQGDRNDF